MSPFNLIQEPWLPVARRSGAVAWIAPERIVDGLAEDPFVAFAWPRADFNGAACELLIGLLCTAAAPPDDSEWEKWWEEPPSPEVLGEKFALLSPAFDLDGPGPRFLQDLDPLEDTKEEPVSGLLIDAPGAQTVKHNKDVFVRRGGTPVLGCAAAAMALYTLQAYAPPGGSGHRTSVRGGGPLTTLVDPVHPESGKTLWGRLWANVETEEQIERRPGPDRRATPVPSPSVFPWLALTRTSNPPKKGTKGRETTPVDADPLQVYWGMPRRIRLQFEETQGRPCGVTGLQDSAVVKVYRTRTYGTNYSEGFLHPLSPYYTDKDGIKRPVHPHPGGLGYREFPGVVIESDDKRRVPAQVVPHWRNERRTSATEVQLAAFGYDMDNMKCRTWIERELPLWSSFERDRRDFLDLFIRQTTKGADRASFLLTGAIKSALHDRPKDARGDYGFIAERFFRETEVAFYRALGDAQGGIERAEYDEEDPTRSVRERWARVLAQEVLRLFDDIVPIDALDTPDPSRSIRQRHFLALGLRGRGKTGLRLYGDLGISPPPPKEAA